ncbi:hypothetical protein [Halorarum salinum]|uniref:Replication protein n=1 Tax=Halorarum salinum TaxID=2743089 RepID=A0A7D5QL84_9EURY|nr:hypothetical protein [Halobaculum salinum]QLG62645.1 hypothetical protein HUG12_13290 [Halobaculum salinum]
MSSRDTPVRDDRWAGDGREADKWALVETARNHPEGLPFSRWLALTFGEPDGADHELGRGVLADAGDLLHSEEPTGRVLVGTPDGEEIRETAPDLCWVYPRSALYLTANKHSPKHADRTEVGEPRGDEPKANARAALGRRRVVETDAERGHLLGTLATYRETTEDRYLRFDRVRGSGPEHVLAPYATRFNAPERVGAARSRYEEAWDVAGERYDSAVVLTPTTCPWWFESLAEAASSLSADVNRLKSWLASPSRLGDRPESVVVYEWADRALPHPHIILFGVNWAVSESELSHYWSARRDRGVVVDACRLRSRGPGAPWRWASSDERPEDARGRGPRAYFGKMLTAADEFARASPSEVRAASRALRRSGARGAVGSPEPGVGDGAGAGVEGAHGADRDADGALARGRRWWKLALYWATGMKWFTRSPSLAREDESAEDELPHVPCYEFVGVAKLGEMPGYVLRDAVVIPRRRGAPGSSKPPPGGGGS